jgi:hypothetical protein
MDDLSSNARANYFYARRLVGRDLSYPAVRSKACAKGN